MPIKKTQTRLIVQNAGSGKSSVTEAAEKTTQPPGQGLAGRSAAGDVEPVFTPGERAKLNLAVSSPLLSAASNLRPAVTSQARANADRLNSNKRQRKQLGRTLSFERSSETRLSFPGASSQEKPRQIINETNNRTQTDRVWSFEPTDYDVFLTGSGVNSYQPVIIADVPFSNYYGSESPSFDIVKLQQQLQDDVLRTANNLVKQFYSLRPEKARELQQIRDKNLSFYNEAVPAVSSVALASRELIVALNTTDRPSDQSYYDIVNATRTSLKYAGVAPVPVITTPYDDDDVIKISKFSSAYDALLTNGQIYKSTLLGQVLSDKVGLLKYGVSLENAANRVNDAVPANEIANVWAGPLNYGVYRNVLLRAVTAWKEGGFIQDDAFLSLYKNDDNFSVNIYSIPIDTYTNTYEAIGGYNKDDAPDKPFGVYGIMPKFISKVQEKSGTPFKPSILILITSHLINEVLGGEIVNNATLPQFMRSVGSGASGAKTYTINSTASEDKLPLTVLLSKYYSLFDAIIPDQQSNDTQENRTSGLLAATTFDIDEIFSLQDKIATARSRLEKTIVDNTGYFSNQISVFLMKCMFDEYYSFFKNSVLTTGTNQYSLARTAIFLRAAANEDVRGIVWAMCNNKTKIRNAAEIPEFETAISDSITSLFRRDQTYTTAGSFTFSQYSDKVEQDEDDAAENRDASSTFLESLFDNDSSFGMFDRIASKVIERFPQIDGTDAEGAVRITSYIVFLQILRLLSVEYKLQFTEEKAGSNYNGVQGYIRFSKRDTTAVTDCLKSALTTSNITDFSTYAAARGGQPYEETKAAIRSNFWTPIRGIVRDVLGAYETFADASSYTHTLLTNAYKKVADARIAYNSLTRSYERLDTLSTADAQLKARDLIAKYGTPESVIELNHRSKRYSNLISGTDITSMASRSSYFRSITDATHRDILTERQAKIYIVGIPYGMLENLRLEQPVAQTYIPRFNVHINKFVGNSSQRVDYYLPQDTLSGSLGSGYAYQSNYTQISDKYDSTTQITSYADRRINVDVYDFSLKQVQPVTFNNSAAYEAQKVQSALESYVEDLYGLYPRYSFIKAQPQRAIVENQIADEIANTLPADDQEAQLVRSRMKAAVLMHRDFCTTTMINDLETSPLFDKIVYCLVESETAGNLANIAAEVQV